ncbi:PspC domain-containing protein [Rubellicoccus peritrichatus]|uniref:PspC domain-containing protein n=1 Tax=Rubellicoccus peritrichatus TaxID=3080537 RepID=A0AAQ3LF29_9BACT|nr:PspC domain-containing protein [Puniceicoccus sp. CR14]WOO43389.1 PspC domain-containing protein [Puniceicoccus sp. CR14]
MPSAEKALKRSSNRVIGGVCGGIAEYYGWDPSILRLVYLIVSIVSTAFPGIIVYIILWIVIPPAED